MGGTIPGSIPELRIGDVLHQLCQFVSTYHSGGVEGVEFLEDSLSIAILGVGPSNLAAFICKESIQEGSIEELLFMFKYCSLVGFRWLGTKAGTTRHVETTKQAFVTEED